APGSERPTASGMETTGGKAHGDGTGSADRRTIWVLKDGVPRPAALRVGVTDGTMTEVLEGELSPGDACIVDADGGSGKGGKGSSQRPPRMF
ncbi:MAG: hypothetical protein WCC48_00810, partial [Anaeromyxobacteraceae bacterium]